MMRIINFDNVSYTVGNNILLRELNFSIEKGSFVSVIGNNGSGKSTLVKILAGLIDYNGYVNINGYCLDKNNIYDIRKNMGVILDDINGYFVFDNVYDVLAVGLENLGFNDNEIKIKIDNIVKLFGIEDIIDKDIYSLTNSERQIVKVASVISRDVQILVMDDCLNQLSVSDKRKVLGIIRDYKKKKKMTVIMVTHDMEDVLYSDRVMVLNKGLLVMDGSSVSVLKQVDKLNKFGIGSTFAVDLSSRLINRGIVNHVYLDMKRLVDRLWK